MLHDMSMLLDQMVRMQTSGLVISDGTNTLQPALQLGWPYFCLSRMD